ncbi:hypothetical protein [Shewanella surugensis]|uniref:Uncharacterized protein n=1 Tax=Shewanella surugensis TaxID=212020 RepID=A0ABT0LDU6_9GAMM|nr:hypothetical protein [Shewanella surugensis]MCL1125864.1 hypothetical protein [Shewanella surugensis]
MFFKRGVSTASFLGMILLDLSSVSASTIEVEKHQAVGTHGMVLMKINHQLYASHLSLAHSMHAQQILFRLSVHSADKQAIDRLMADNALVTLMPERFDLHRLMNQSLTSFNSDLFAGHFERGGTKVLSRVSITIDELVLNQPMLSSRLSASNGVYYQIGLNAGDVLFVHKIADNSSFDHIFLGKTTSSTATDKAVALTNRKAHTTSSQPLNQITQVDFNRQHPVNERDVQTQLSAQGITYLRSLYLETQDFTD